MGMRRLSEGRRRPRASAPPVELGLSSRARSRYLPRVDFRVLGPIEVEGAEGSVALGGPKQRAVLALLLVRANQHVSFDSLIDGLWGEEPPESARATIHAYVHNLRRALGSHRIESRQPGYFLRAEADELDASRFEALVRDARRLGEDPVRAAQALRDALALWRGSAFADLETFASLQGEMARLEELRLRAIEDRIGFELAAGRHDSVLGELELLVHDHPLRESLWEHLMLACYRAGRQGDALETFEAARRVLADELGVDPSPELRRLQEQILRQDPALELRGQPLRGYRLLERIGDGAFGVVHRALQPQVGREVAIKSIHSHLANDLGFVRRFEREAQLVTRLEHPHVVPLYDYWRDSDGAYLVMRFLQGGSLRQRIEKRDELTTDEVTLIIEQVAEALSAAHRQEIVHGDVKPENVLLDTDGNAYLSDFGIVNEGSTSRETLPGTVGTPGYLAPEQIRGEPITPRTDVYSLGIVLYESLCGEHPFPDAPMFTLFERHLRDTLPSVLADRPDLPPAVDEVIARATAKAPEDRYPDVAALAAAFREAISAAEPGLVLAAPGPADRNPYKGLRPFDEADALDFFGREALVERLLDRMSERVDGSRLLGVVGPSGSGKSSVVRAGLVPALRSSALVGSDSWFFVDMTPGDQPFAELEAALLRVAVHPPSSLMEQLASDERGFLETVERILPPDGSELFLLIDQFEELFTLVDDEPLRARFLASLVTAASDPGSRIRIVLTLRADFYDRPLAYQWFGELLGTRAQTVTALSPPELERAVAGPAERVGVTPEPALLAEIAADAVDRPGALPLLQYALTVVFDRRRNGTLSLADYHHLGGLGGALAGGAEDLYITRDAVGKEATRQLFLRLVNVEEDLEDVRHRIRRSELESVEVDREAMGVAIDAYGRRRLLTFDRDPLTREPTVEVAHEALLLSWDRLKGWIEMARDDVRTERRLASDAAEWRQGGRDPSFLLRGSRLEHLESWASGTDIALGMVDREFLDASLLQRDQERRAEEARQEREALLKRRSVLRLRGLVAVLTVGALVAGSLALVAADRGRQSARESRIALARELASAAVANLHEDTQRSLLLALEAVGTTRRIDGTVLPEAEEALHRALQADRLVFSVPAPNGGGFSADGTRLLAMQGRTVHVYDSETGELIDTGEGERGSVPVAVSPNGELFATVASGGRQQAIVYETTTGKELLRVGKRGGCRLTFTPDDRYLITQTCEESDNFMSVWDLQTGELTNRLRNRTLPLAFSPNGQHLLTGTAWWNVGRGPFVIDPLEPGGGPDRFSLRGLRGAQDELNAGAWSLDGSLLATANPGKVIVWDARTGNEMFRVFPPAGQFTTVSFVPGSRLATGMRDGTVIVWKLSHEAAEPILTLAGHDAQIEEISSTPDGTRLSTSSLDGRIKVWDITPEGGREWLTVSHSDKAHSYYYRVPVDLSPNGRLLAAGGWDGQVHVYDAHTGRRVRIIPGLGAEVTVVDYDPTGSMLATGSPHGDMHIWDVVSGTEISNVQFGEGNELWDVAFSPDGSTVATSALTDPQVQLWDPATGRHRKGLFGNRPDDGWWPRSVAFSPDGRLLAGESWNYVYVWDIEQGLMTTMHEQGVNGVAFSPDGRRLVTAASDGSVRLWDPRTGRRLGSVSGNLGELIDVAFVPDGSRIVTSSSDGTVRLWDGATLEPLLTLASDAERGKLGLSQDGTRLAYPADDGTIRVLALDIDDLMELARSRLTRTWTQDECKTYLHVEACPPWVTRPAGWCTQLVCCLRSSWT